MARNDIKNSSLLKTKFLIYAFNGRTFYFIRAPHFLFNLKNKKCILHHFAFLVDAQHAKKSLPKTSYFHPNRPL